MRHGAARTTSGATRFRQANRDFGVGTGPEAVEPRRSEGDGNEVFADLAQSRGGDGAAQGLARAVHNADGQDGRADFNVSFPGAGRIVLRRWGRFECSNDAWVREFIETSFGVREVRSVEIDTFRREAHLVHTKAGRASTLFQRLAWVDRGTEAADLQAISPPEVFQGIPASQPRLRTYRYGRLVNTWELRREVPGRIRLRNLFVLNKEHLLRPLKRELTSLLGIESYRFERWIDHRNTLDRHENGRQGN